MVQMAVTYPILLTKTGTVTTSSALTEVIIGETERDEILRML